MSLVIGVPVKAFGVAKQRLSPVLSAEERSTLGVTVATRTLELAAQHGEAVVLTGDRDVVLWAAKLGFGTVFEVETGLNAAGEALVGHAAGRPWMMLHADLPQLQGADLENATALIKPESTVLAASWDGGTSLLSSTGPFPFSYGPGSFHKHLAARPWAHVLSSPGLAMDLDTPTDLKTLQSLDV